MRLKHGWSVHGVILATCMGCLLGILPVFLFLYFVPQTLKPALLDVKDARYFPKLVQNDHLPAIEGLPTMDVSATTSPRMLFVGDLMLDRSVVTRTKVSKSSSYPFDRLPKDWLASFEYTVVNLEGPVTDKRRLPEKSIDFVFDPATIPVMKEAGIDAFSQANNHALDQGREGATDSRRRLQEAGFTVFGDQVNDGDIALATTTVKGLKLGLVGFNTTDNLLDEQAAIATMAKARVKSDHVIVYMHWGIEYRDRPTDDMRRRAQWFIDQGADAVIGSHPHWVQGIESYKGRPIVYSLGNFVFDQDFSPQTRQGLAIALQFQASTTLLALIPLQIDLSQPRLVDSDERIKRLEGLAKISEEGLAEQIKAGMVSFIAE